MRCSICRRPLLHCAVPGLQIGPKCAKDRGLLPDRQPRASVFTHIPRATRHDGPGEWINLSNAGQLDTET